MLGSMARKLRILGFDTKYLNSDDESLLHVAKEERRLLVTADRALASGAKRTGTATVLVEGDNDRTRLERLFEASAELGTRLVAGPSRCGLCNVELVRLSRQEAEGRVPFGVWSKHRLFLSCPSCGRTYWRGGHWKKLRRLPRPRAEGV